MSNFLNGFVDELTKVAKVGAMRKALASLPPGTKDALKSMGLWSGIDYALAPEKGVGHAVRSGAGFVGGDILAGKLLGGLGGPGLKGKGLRFAGQMLGGMMGAQALHNMARKKQGDYERARSEKTARVNVKVETTEPGNPIPVVTHEFSGKTEAEARGYMASHRKTDKFFDACFTGSMGKVECDNSKETVTKTAADLTARGRGQVKGKNFALPGDRYPIHDRAHARNALARVAQHGSLAEQVKVRAKVQAKYPGIGKEANDPVKETINIHGIPIALEWRRGEQRKYFNHDPLKSRSVGKIDYDQKMHADYGYIKGVIDADGEELDVYLGPNRESEKVYVLEKLRRTDGSFDENKIMLGYDSLKEARDSYLKHQGKDELGKVYELTLPLFKQKFLRSNKFKKHGSPKHPTAQERFYTSQKKKQKVNELLKKAGFLRERVREGNSSELIGQLHKKRRQIEKMAGACVRTLTWGGLTMKFEYLKGDTRSGTGEGGKKWSRKMKDCYGYIPGTYGKGADGEAIDVYFNPEALDGPVFKIRQLTKEGKYDEDKFMVGYGSADAARSAFARNMPKWAFGDMTSMTMKSFRTLVGQEGRKVRVPSDGNAERERVRRAMERKSA